MNIYDELFENYLWILNLCKYFLLMNIKNMVINIGLSEIFISMF